MRTIFLCLLSSFAFSITSYSQESLITPYKGSSTLGAYSADHDMLNMPTYKMGASSIDMQMVEGEIESHIYKYPEGTSVFAIYSSFKNELEKAGFNLTTAGPTKDLPNSEKIDMLGAYRDQFRGRAYSGEVSRNTSNYLWAHTYAEYIIAANKKIADKSYFILIVVSDKQLYSVDVITAQAQAEGLVALSEELLQQGIAAEGKSVLNGLLFATGQAELLPESQEALAVIVAYLSKSTEYFYVVGHTDNDGNLETNLKLSRARAESIVSALQDMGINGDRLSAQGVGPFCPRQSNKADGGKSSNRRVELVLR
jgi:outer membrane protein OmpA-like peptidoglycan-associated protein